MYCDSCRLCGDLCGAGGDLVVGYTRERCGTMWRGWSITLALVLVMASAASCHDTQSVVNKEVDSKVGNDVLVDIKTDGSTETDVNTESKPVPKEVEDEKHVDKEPEDKSLTNKKAKEKKSAEKKTPAPEQKQPEMSPAEAELLRQKGLARLEKIRKQEGSYGKS